MHAHPYVADSSASSILEKQKGTYFDTDINYLIDYDKRNQKFQTTDGYRSRFTQSLPIISETNALINGYEFNVFKHKPDENADNSVGNYQYDCLYKVKLQRCTD